MRCCVIPTMLLCAVGGAVSRAFGEYEAIPLEPARHPGIDIEPAPPEPESAAGP
jgi:hypothetical protein